MKKLHKIFLAVVVAVFALSISPMMNNNHANVAQAAIKHTIHHKKGTQEERYTKIRKRGNVYVTTTSGGYYYKNASLTRYAKKHGYKAGKILRVKKIVLYHGLKRFELANGLYITAYHAHFNYRLTYKKAIKKMVKNEIIIKKARKHKKTKKYSKKKKVTHKKSIKKNNDTTILEQGKLTKSTKAPTDPNADPYAGKHQDGDLWFQQSNDNKTIVNTFTYKNGNWVNLFGDNQKKTKDNKTNKNNQNTREFIKSIQAPTDPNADPYAGKHQNGDQWLQVSLANLSQTKYVYMNGSWIKQDNNSNTDNNNNSNGNYDDYQNAYALAIQPDSGTIVNIDKNASISNQLGTFAAIMAIKHNVSDAIDNVPAVNFNNQTVTVGGKNYKLDTSASYTAPKDSSIESAIAGEGDGLLTPPNDN